MKESCFTHTYHCLIASVVGLGDSNSIPNFATLPKTNHVFRRHTIVHSPLRQRNQSHQETKSTNSERTRHQIKFLRLSTSVFTVQQRIRVFRTFQCEAIVIISSHTRARTCSISLPIMSFIITKLSACHHSSMIQQHQSVTNLFSSSQ